MVLASTFHFPLPARPQATTKVYDTGAQTNYSACGLDLGTADTGLAASFLTQNPLSGPNFRGIPGGAKALRLDLTVNASSFTTVPQVLVFGVDDDSNIFPLLTEAGTSPLLFDGTLIQINTNLWTPQETSVGEHEFVLNGASGVIIFRSVAGAGPTVQTLYAKVL